MADCLTFPVSLQWLSRDKRLPVDTWNTSEIQENVFGHQFSTFDIHPEIIIKELTLAKQREQGPVPQATRTLTFFTRDEDQIRGTIPMPTFVGKPSTMHSFLPAEIPQNTLAVKQRQQISELQFDKFPDPQSFSSDFLL